MKKKLLTGEELVRQKSILQRDFPSSGAREFAPTDTWLEKKQIQTCLEDKHALLKNERIEKTANLSTAEWMPEIQKAKVTKKIGKYWEVFGHAKDNADWLYPEEALFLLETNALRIFHGQVPVSIEQGYLLLIGNGCTLNEYYVFSSLSKKGYKLIRHNKDAITQNPSDLDKSNETIEDCINIDCVDDQNDAKEKGEVEKNEKLDESAESDVFIIEDVVEIIEVDSDSPDSNVKPEKNKKVGDSILIESDDDEVVYLPTTSKSECRSWYKPLNNSLIPHQQEQTEHTNFKNIDDLKDKTMHEILKNIDGSNKEIMSSPDDRFIPEKIKPSHSMYKVNLREFIDDSKDYENENPNERGTTVQTPINNHARRYLQRPYNYRETSDTNYNMMNPNAEMGRISPHIPNYSNSNFQKAFNHRRGGRGRGYHSNFPMQPYRNNDPHPSRNTEMQPFRNNKPHPFRNDERHPSPNTEMQPFRNTEMQPVRDNSNLLAQTFDMRLMAVNMLNTAYHLLAASETPPQQPYQPHQPYQPFQPYQPYQHNPPYQRRSQNNFSHSNANYHQRTWKPRHRGSKKRSRYNRSPNSYDSKIIPTTSSNVNATQDFIVLDSDEDEKKPKKPIKFSKAIKKVECIDITGDVTPTHTRFPETDEEVDVCTNKPQLSQTEINECSSKDVPVKKSEQVKPDQNEMEIDILDFDVSNKETPKTDVYTQNRQPGNWEQYKLLPSMQKEHDIIDPLINLNEIETINGNIYESLQIFKPFSISPDQGKQFKISFDMYSPNEQFKKSTRASPKFRIIVQSIHDVLPSKYDIDALKNIYRDGVPFLIAIVLEESISYYMYDCVTIPNLF